MNTPLRTARIVGFFSIPSPSLAEHNPSAYNNLVSNLPAGCGVCSQCGMGIMHHIVIVDEAGVRRFIGSDCAEKIGLDREAVKHRLTDEEVAARQARRDARKAEFDAAVAAREAVEAERRERFADILAILAAQNSEFHSSLASQLIQGPLSWRQAMFVAKATSETRRRNKRNAAAWDEVESRVQS